MVKTINKLIYNSFIGTTENYFKIAVFFCMKGNVSSWRKKLRFSRITGSNNCWDRVHRSSIVTGRSLHEILTRDGKLEA